VRLVNAPKGFDGQVFGRSRVTSDAQNPAVDSALVLVKERLKGGCVPLPEKVQDAARSILHPPLPLLLTLTLPAKQRLHAIG
jgi:hypothetical protein